MNFRFAISLSLFFSLSLGLFLPTTFATASTYGSGTYGSGGYSVVVDTTPTSTPTPTPPRGGGGGGGVTQPIGFFGTTTDQPTTVQTPVSSSFSTTISSLRALVNLLVSLGIIPADKVDAVLAALSSTSVQVYTRNLQLHDTGTDVTSLQNYLIRKGYLTQDLASGYFGTRTYTALKTYQADVGLPSTGYFGPLSRSRISN